MPHHLTVGYLLNRLKDLDPNLRVRLAVNPDFPFAHFVGASIVISDGLVPHRRRRTGALPPARGPRRPRLGLNPPRPPQPMNRPSLPARTLPARASCRPSPPSLDTNDTGGALTRRISDQAKGPLDVTGLPTDTSQLAPGPSPACAGKPSEVTAFATPSPSGPHPEPVHPPQRGPT